MGALEQPVFMILKGSGKRLWSTLVPDYLIGGPADLNLKQGLRLAGEWHVVGVLDCEPGSPEFADLDRICGGDGNIMGHQFPSMWREFWAVFGRPEDCYGITPLIIMREIS